MNIIDREAEIAWLSKIYGVPVRTSCALDMSRANDAWWSTEKAVRRDGEVALFIRRRNGNLILHTKAFYPNGVLRVPTGGIKGGEAVIAAVHRETREETSLQVSIERFLTLVEFEFHCQGRVIPYPSYSFLLREMAGATDGATLGATDGATLGDLKALDPDERIAAFAEVPFSELPAIAERLEQVPPSWQDWGQFRAIPHRAVAKLLGF